MARTLNEWRDEIKRWAISKGWDGEGTPPSAVLKEYITEKLLLIHTEVSEGTEDLRVIDFVNTPYEEVLDTLTLSRIDQKGKPVGFSSEIIDIIIRCLQLCGALGINVDEEMVWKMAYNEGRPYRHGKNM